MAVTRCFNRNQNDLLPRLRLIKTPNGDRAKRGGGSTCHICGNTALRDNYNADIQESGAGDFAHGARAFRRNCCIRRKCHRGFGPSLSPLSPSLPPALPPPRQRRWRILARRQRRDRPVVRLRTQLRGHGVLYGNESGSKTASGQRFNQNALTCAHRSLPFGTRLRVTHGDRSVVVTVNDRGPFVRGRVLDLSTAAARAVGITGAGVGRVVAEVM